MEPVAELQVGNMSKNDILRGVITEKLSTAAREIFAVVERTVAGYEEEAAGFRLEVEQQRRQLELLLRASDIKLEAADDQQLFPVSEPLMLPQPEEVPGGGEPTDEEQQHKYELSVEEEGGGMSLPCLAAQYAEGEESTEHAFPTPTEDQEPIAELDFDAPSVQSDRQSAGDAQDHVDLRIRILWDSEVNILHTDVYRKYPLQELQCPRGLRETDFLQMLRSTFPLLAGDFDFLTTSRSRRLRPLRVRTLTPEEIQRSITSNGRTTLYIRLKNSEKPQVADEKLRPSQRGDAADDALPCHSQSGRKKTPARALGTASKNHIDIMVWIVENTQIKRLSVNAFKKIQGKQLRCPLGLQETDFLRLLRSTFPQLAGDKQFDAFTTDRKRRLLPLAAEMLSPEEISTSSGSCRCASLYVRLKRREKRLRASTDRTNLHASIPSARKKLGRRPSKPSPVASTSHGEALPCCKVCGALRGSESMVIKHAWSHVDAPARLCGVCGERSESAEHLRQHLQSHQKTHVCHICGKSFLSMNGLRGHVVRHNGEKPHECAVCHKFFTHSSPLNAHMLTHAPDTWHTCDVCHKTFATKMQLNIHSATHADKKPFCCVVCTKSYCTLSRLSQHAMTHSAARA